MSAEPTQETDVPVLDIARLEQQLDTLHATYQAATPYPHIVLDNFLEPGVAERAMAEFPPLDPEQWNNYLHANERKFSNTDPGTWRPTLRSILTSSTHRFVEVISSLIGVDHLVPDPSLEGGGLHQSETGGFLNIHADFTAHPHNGKWLPPGEHPALPRRQLEA